MKLGHKILLLVTFVMLFCGITFAAERNYIELTHNDNVVHVLVHLTEEASVASFQIGLKITGAPKEDIEFDWNSALVQSGELFECSYDVNKEIMNLYYVGAHELNDDDSHSFEVGSFTLSKSSSYSVTITPNPNTTIASSVSHKTVPFDSISEQNDKISFHITKTGSGSTGGGSNSKPSSSNDNEGLLVEKSMKENSKLNTLDVELRSTTEDGRANQNIYVIGDKIFFYIDYKNGGKDITDKVTLELELPFDFKVIKNDGANFSKSKRTLTWTLSKLESGQSGTKEVEIEYIGLGDSDSYAKDVATASVSVSGTKKATSSVVNMVLKEQNVEIDELHEPYMRGDSEGNTFRPDSTMTRGEAAIVLTRIFNINTNFTDNVLAFPDLANTYPEARNAVRAAVQSGLVTGYPDGTYKPDNPVTHAEFMTIMARQLANDYKTKDGLEIKEIEELLKLYNDKDHSGYLNTDEHWGVIYTTYLARLNMTPLGDDNTYINLDSNITRAEVTQLVNYYLFRAPVKVNKETTSKFSDVPTSHKLLGDIIEATRDSHKLNLTNTNHEK